MDNVMHPVMDYVIHHVMHWAQVLSADGHALHSALPSLLPGAGALRGRGRRAGHLLRGQAAGGDGQPARRGETHSIT